MEKAKYGKMRQVNAVNGSKMVVKIGMGYYRGVKGKDVEINWVLPHSLTALWFNLYPFSWRG